MRQLIVIVAVCVIASFGQSSATSDRAPASGERWWSHVNVLADDSMEGRNTGSPGHKRAVVVYITSAPKALPGPLQAHFGSAAERWKMYKAAGAIGTLTIANPKSM